MTAVVLSAGFIVVGVLLALIAGFLAHIARAVDGVADAIDGLGEIIAAEDDEPPEGFGEESPEMDALIAAAIKRRADAEMPVENPDAPWVHSDWWEVRRGGGT
jgi:hypothetical protein